MVQDPLPSAGPALRPLRHGARSRVAVRAASVAILAAIVSSSVFVGGLPGPRMPSGDGLPTPIAGSQTDTATADDTALADAEHTLGAQARSHWREALRDAFPDWSSERPSTGTEAPTPFAQLDTAPAEEVTSPEQPARLPKAVPLPVPRPPEFRRSVGPEASRRAERQASRRVRSAEAPAPVVDERSFLEKLFNVEKPASPALAYAALEAPGLSAIPRRPLVPTPIDPAATAIYDISARIVTLPNGTKLEAHSGLGETMDDPRNVHLKMRGATPPGTYDLTEREDLFHGVRAIRLNPVGGSAAVYGRVGLLAHTYMLGPTGASNGCVSFKDYNAFLQAYLRGEIQRIVVVPGNGQDAPPSIARNNPTAPGRSARLGNDV